MKIKINNALVFSLVFLYILYYGTISIVRFYSFGFHDFDLAIFSLSTWNILHGSMFNSIMDIQFLGVHASLILFFIAPIYFLFQHPLTLLLLQTLVLASGALPLYFLTRKVLDERWALLVSFGYLFYPALAYTNLFEFHPPVFATFFLILAFCCYEYKSFLPFITFSLLAMLCQENIPLAVIGFGVLAFCERRALIWIIVPVLTGIAYFIFAITLMSLLNNDTVQYFGLYRALGDTPAQIVLNIFTHPQIVIKLILRREFLSHMLNLFWPLLFIPLLSPLKLLPLLPFLLQHALSIRSTELSIYYHYTAELIPFIFVALIYGIKFLLRSKISVRPLFLKSTLLLTVFLAGLYFGPHFRIYKVLTNRNYEARDKALFTKKVPRARPVVATFEFLPHLTQRRSLYSFHHVYRGFHTLSIKPYYLPDDAEYALIDFNDPLTFRNFYSNDAYVRLKGFISDGNWRAQDFLDTVVFFEKNGKSGTSICQMGFYSDNEIEEKVDLNIEDSVQLSGYTLSKDSGLGVLSLVFYWRSLNATERDINILLDILDNNDNLLMRKIRPVCYRIFPTNSWNKGESFKEALRLRIPFSLRNYKIKASFFDYQTGEFLKTNGSLDPLGRVTIIDASG